MKEWIIEPFKGKTSLNLTYSEEISEFGDILMTNGFHIKYELFEFIPSNETEAIDLKYWIHNERNDYIVDWSNCIGSVVIFYCHNQKILFECIKEITQTISNIMNIQEKYYQIEKIER